MPSKASTEDIGVAQATEIVAVFILTIAATWAVINFASVPQYYNSTSNLSNNQYIPVGSSSSNLNDAMHTDEIALYLTQYSNYSAPGELTNLEPYAQGGGGSGGGVGCASTPAFVCALFYAQTQLKVPYCYGGEAPKGKDPFPTSGFDCQNQEPPPLYTPGISKTSGGFDCSGLARWAYAQAGIGIDRVTTEEWTESNLKPVSKANAEAGTLVFFYSYGADNPEHVGICTDNGCTQMIDAPDTGAYVRYDSLKTTAQCVNGGGTSSWCILGYREPK